MTGTVQMNTPEVVFWFGLFPILAAFVIAFLYVGLRNVARRVEARFQARIDCALALPLSFDDERAAR